MVNKTYNFKFEGWKTYPFLFILAYGCFSLVMDLYKFLH